MDTLQILLDFFTDYSYFAVFSVLLVCGLGVPIPEDVTLVAGGIISGLGYADVYGMLFVCMAGVLSGDCIMFIVGRLFGRQVLNFRLIALVFNRERFTLVQEKFEKYGNWVLFVARFLPGLRSLIFITAGMTRRIAYKHFLLMDGVAALISVPAWVWLGYYGAGNREWLMAMVRHGQWGLLSVAVALLLGVVSIWFRSRRLVRCVKK